MTYELMLLSKRHRKQAYCSLCEKWRICTRLPLIALEQSRQTLVETFSICGPCGREIVRIASEGLMREKT